MPISKSSSALIWAWAVLIPFLVQAALIILHKELSLSVVPRPGAAVGFVVAALGFATFAISTLIGFFVLALRFTAIAVYIAVIYIPVMVVLLVLFSGNLIGGLYNDYL